MEDQGSRPILIVEENFDSIVKSQSAMWSINGGYFWSMSWKISWSSC